ncbi:flagellar hook-length control protein FliK, partial [Azospirillum sp.]|uniref:flagellar hook-length control protein FliK n=1 Tax=Azospirillum sp. TaxID=34012 RepID=UPI002D65FBFC
DALSAPAPAPRDPRPAAPPSRDDGTAADRPFASLLDEAAEPESDADADAKPRKGGAPASADAALAAVLPWLAGPPPQPPTPPDGTATDSAPALTAAAPTPAAPPLTPPTSEPATQAPAQLAAAQPAGPQPPVPPTAAPQPAAPAEAAPQADAAPPPTTPQTAPPLPAATATEAPRPTAPSAPERKATTDAAAPTTPDATNTPTPSPALNPAAMTGNGAGNGQTGNQPGNGQPGGNPPSPAPDAVSTAAPTDALPPLPPAQAASHYAATVAEHAAATRAPTPSAQLAAPLVRVAEAGGGEFQIDLSPADLGHVRVVAEVTDGRIALSVQAEHADTLALLRRDVHQLERALAGAGFELDGASLQFSLRGDEQPRGFAGSHPDGGGRRTAWFEDPAAPTPPERAAVLIDGIVDVTV